VTLDGRYVHLDGARVRPAPAGGGIPIAIAARGPRMLELVATHGDSWDVNLPPVASRVRAAAAQLAEACRRCGRDPGEVTRSQWIFTRVDPALDAAAALREYRKLNPWFGAIPEAELATGLAVGSAAHCRGRIAELARELSLDLPVIDLSGLAAAPARRVMEGLAPVDTDVDA
jgi:alkanesulfonate monooxygenase SsuD/methylene tetrahydromethanopterin reductase-like flavin-dependent oxidoreductase (luciferase family)